MKAALCRSPDTGSTMPSLLAVHQPSFTAVDTHLHGRGLRVCAAESCCRRRTSPAADANFGLADASPRLLDPLRDLIRTKPDALARNIRTRRANGRGSTCSWRRRSRSIRVPARCDAITPARNPCSVRCAERAGDAARTLAFSRCRRGAAARPSAAVSPRSA